MYGQEINIYMVNREKHSKELFQSFLTLFLYILLPGQDLSNDTQYVFFIQNLLRSKYQTFQFSINCRWGFFFFLQETNLLLQQVEGVKPSVPITAGIEFSLRHPMFRKRISTVPITNFPDYTLTPRPIVK